MTVLVTGAGGQLGLDLVDAFAPRGVVGLTHAELDVADEASVTSVVTELAPALVVNAAAWTDVDACEHDPGRAHRVNALGPWWLARACRLVGATLVTVSTDYVFDGRVPQPRRGWTEFDEPRPINVYGRTKAAGEALVRSVLAEHHIVRTSWVAGARGDNVVRTIVERMLRQQPLRMVTDQVGAVTYTRDLAAAIVELAATNRYGTWHRTNQGATTWHEVATVAASMLGLDADISEQQLVDLDRAAPRPAWCLLDDTHATAAGLTPLPPWRDGLRRLLSELGHDPASDVDRDAS